MLLGISILYNSIIYLLATSTLTWSPLILFIDSVENLGTQIGTFVALGAGLAAISLGQLSRTVLDFLDPCANPLSVVNRLADSIDPESISSEVVLSAEDTLFAILNKYIIKSIRESRVDEYSKAIRAIETITETLLNEIEDVESNLFQLFGADDSFDSEERDKLLQRRHKLKDSPKGVVESWEYIISVSVAEGRSSQLRNYGYTAHEYYREIFTRPLPEDTFDPLRDLVFSLSVDLVRDDRMRTDTMPEGLPGKADIDDRDRSSTSIYS